ncbi:MAG: class I poly(R)-hydroxyalkanoic acid synthase, partial [Serpentinimonas sp.]|nr:class I poly(R)-hydroxyalkanoic acid synthase [Serpentinimonas sp.]
MNTPPNPWLQAAQQFQQSALQQWGQMLQANPAAATPQPAFTPFAAPGGVDLNEMLSKVAGHPVQIEPTRLLQIQGDYLKDLGQLWSQGLQ